MQLHSLNLGEILFPQINDSELSQWMQSIGWLVDEPLAKEEMLNDLLSVSTRSWPTC